MKVIPETIELDETDLKAAIELWVRTMTKRAGSLEIVFQAESQRTPTLVMGVTEHSENIKVTAKAYRRDSNEKDT